MDADDIVIIVENEAESVPVQEQSAKAPGSEGLMDVCPVCKLSFHSREPQLLPCLHSVCKKCLPAPARSLACPGSARAGHPQADSAQKPLNIISCPVCQQECVDADVLENFFVKDAMEVPSSTVEKTSQLCMSCEDNTEATGYCVECVEFLCVTCVEAHQRVKFTRGHSIRQKEEMSTGSVGPSTQKPVFCDIHKQEPLKLFCETCDRLTCRDCQLLKHKDHNYQFLEDAYRNHREHLENMTRQLQEKRRAIEEVSHTINTGLQQVDENRKAVAAEVKKSVCNLVMEINRKGKILVNQLEALTKDHETGLRKQQEDVSAISKHLDHVINFTKWATASSSGTALLYCKRLILCQIQYLMRTKCNPSFVPQSLVRFQCRSAFWASNVDLGSLVVEKVTARQPTNIQVFPSPPSQPGPRAEGPIVGFPGGLPQQRQSTLAQLQMQVDKLAMHPIRQPPPNHWPWYQNARMPAPPPPRPMQGGSPSQGAPNMGPQGRRYPARSPPTMMQNTGLPPQVLRGVVNTSNFPHKPMDAMQGTSRYPANGPPPSGCPPFNTPSSLHQRNLMDPLFLNKRSEPSGPMLTSVPRPNLNHSMPPAQGRQILATPATAASAELKRSTVSWKRSAPQQDAPPTSSVKRRRRRSSPGPVIVIKDEPEDDDEVRFVQSTVRASLPDSTGVQSQTQLQESPPSEEQRAEKTPDPEEDPNEDWCAVCQNGGELLCCDKCPKVFHLSCHVPSLHSSPSGEWFCSFCRDLTSPEMNYDCDTSRGAVKDEPDSEGFTTVDQRKCERLLLRVYCNELSTDFQEPVSPSRMPEYSQIIRRPMDLSVIKSKLEHKQSPSYTSPGEFVEDVRLIFSNCAKFHKEDTEMAGVGVSLENFFEEQLKLLYPDRTFPSVKEEERPASSSPDDDDDDPAATATTPPDAIMPQGSGVTSPPSIPGEEVTAASEDTRDVDATMDSSPRILQDAQETQEQQEGQ
ncbi:transcription intermediary factor 1-alpha [Denticeps clupeoides]|uniref:RING-type E3 ubiquitin transferase n=1 Tax=Denticeps clupeoides TaxID=299321 RepID=A0AAY4BNM1_9TELE|nr:E3 ubiquitin-protein ligase TRIM33-like [Denticeps clupeoides]